MGKFCKKIVDWLTTIIFSSKTNRPETQEDEKAVSYTLSSVFPSIEIQEIVYEYLRNENEKQVSN